MGIELSQIAKDVVALLAPYLPYLAIAGTEAAKEGGKELGKALPLGAKKIWEILNYNIELRPAGLSEAIQDVSKSPEDSDALELLEVQLKKILKEDNTLAQRFVDALSTENETLSGKYNLQAENVHGVVQGDNANVTMNF